MLFADSNGLQTFLVGVALGQRQRRLHGIANLSAVPLERANLLAGPDELAGRNGDADLAAGIAVQAVKVVSPDALALLVAKVLVVQRNVDAAEEGGVKGADAVGGEEENAAVVLQGTEEDGDEAIAGNVLCAAALEIDVGLVEQDEGAVALAQLEEVIEVGLDTERVDAQIAAGERDERTVGQLSDTLGGACLSDTWRTVKQEDAALALVADEVVAPGSNLAINAGGVLADEGSHGHLDVIVQDEILESLLVGLDWAEIGNMKISPAASTKDEAWNCLAENKVEKVVVGRSVA